VVTEEVSDYIFCELGAYIAIFACVPKLYLFELKCAFFKVNK